MKGMKNDKSSPTKDVVVQRECATIKYWQIILLSRAHQPLIGEPRVDLATNNLQDYSYYHE